MPQCRYGKKCRYHAQGNCRFYHSPSPPPPSRSRSRSRDQFNNSNNNNNDNNLTLNMQSESKQQLQDNISNENALQFMSHEKWGEMNMTQTNDGLEMSAGSHFPTRIGRCKLQSGAYYYEVHLKSTPCNSRIGWGTHSQNIDDINNKRTGEDDNGWAYNGVSKNGHKFFNGKYYQYGAQWSGVGDVVSCAIDIDKSMMSFYLNKKHLGIAFFQFYVGAEGIAPCISVLQGCKVLVVTEKSKFKYKIPNGYSSIQTGFQMTWSRINDRIA
eukprot:429079_1